MNKDLFDKRVTQLLANGCNAELASFLASMAQQIDTLVEYHTLTVDAQGRKQYKHPKRYE